MDTATTHKLTLGPILFHWPAEMKRDFYARIADEAPVDTVYLGEVICSKRAPFFDPFIEEVADRLQRAGKRVVHSTLAEVMLKRERKATEDLAREPTLEIEVNNAAALLRIDGRPHRIGQYFNTYNEATMAYLAAHGATHFALPCELPGHTVAKLVQKAEVLGVPVEVQVFGRASLALSARCYHARAHRRHKDNCQFVCEEDPDGMALSTLTGQHFLAINGIQTLSNTVVSLIAELEEMKAMGISHFRLVPHSTDMVEVARIFRDVLDGLLQTKEAEDRLETLELPGPVANGFWHGKPGHLRIGAGRAA